MKKGLRILRGFMISGLPIFVSKILCSVGAMAGSYVTWHACGKLIEFTISPLKSLNHMNKRELIRVETFEPFK